MLRTKPRVCGCSSCHWTNHGHEPLRPWMTLVLTMSIFKLKKGASTIPDATEKLWLQNTQSNGGTSTDYELCCPEQQKGARALNYKHKSRQKNSKVRQWPPTVLKGSMEETLAISKQSCCLWKIAFSYKRQKKLERTELPGEEVRGETANVKTNTEFTEPINMHQN